MADDLKKIILEVAGDSGKDKKQPEEMVQMVVFALDQEEYAVSIGDLQEIIKIPSITSIPNAPECITGVLNLRGKIVVVVDLEKRFNLVREHAVQPEHIIIAPVNENTFGVMVDHVTEVLRLPISAIQPTSALVSSRIHAEYLKGLVVIEDKTNAQSRLLVLLDLPKVLKDSEFLTMGERAEAEVK